MNLIFNLSLEQRALANIAITLWSKNDVRDLMSKSDWNMLWDNWQEIEKTVIQKSFKLRLPEKLKEKLLKFIVRIGFQLLSWVDVHHCNYRYVTKLPATFVWTSLGTINNKKTAKLLILSGALDDDMSFALACMYCLEEEIKYCWNVINISTCISKFKYVHLAQYWINYMQELHTKELLQPHSPSPLLESTKSGNEVATRYFFKVNKENNDFVTAAVKNVSLGVHNLLNVIPSLQRYSGVMVFLLSKMNLVQQANVIENYTYALLKCLLVWPWHNLFLKILEKIKDKWNSLSKNNYRNLLYHMVALMRYENNIHELFEEFWQQSPEAYKQYVIDIGSIVHILMILYKRGDEKNVKLILKDSSISIRKYILEIDSKEIFKYLVSSKKWDSIEFLIQECLSSLEDFIRFRDLFKNYVHRCLSRNKFTKIKEYQWNEFLQLVDGCILGYNNNNKKKCTEYNNTSSKTLFVEL